MTEANMAKLNARLIRLSDNSWIRLHLIAVAVLSHIPSDIVSDGINQLKLHLTRDEVRLLETLLTEERLD